MTSHITVSASTASATAGTGLSNSTKPAGQGLLGSFGAMLDSLRSAGSATTAAAAAPATTGFTQGMAVATTADSTAATSASGGSSILDLIEKLLRINQPAGTTGTTEPAPLAATADAAVDATSTDAGTPPTLLKNAIDVLKQLDKAEQSGQPVDADLLKKAKQAIDALSGFLAAQQPATPAAAAATPTAAETGSTTAPASAVGSAGSPSDTTNTGALAAARLATAKASLTALSDKLDALSSATATTDPDLAAKLDSLAKALDPTTLSADTLAQLGLARPGEPADPQVASAINGLASGKAAAPAALQPALGTPDLKLPEALTSSGKGGDVAPGQNATDATASLAKSIAGAKAGSNGDSAGQNDKGPDKQAAATLAAAATATDKPPDVPAGNALAADPAAGAATVASVNATARLAQASYQSAAPTTVNLPQMAYEIVRNVQQGTNHFQIRLDPADLGRVDVKMSVDASGNVNARMTVERPETLDLLRRDSAQLGQALTQAGLDGSKTNLQFSLSQNPFTRQDNGGQNGSASAPLVADDDSDAIGAATGVSAATVYRGTATQTGLNLFV